MSTFREMHLVLEELLHYWEISVSVVIIPRDEKPSLEQNPQSSYSLDDRGNECNVLSVTDNLLFTTDA